MMFHLSQSDWHLIWLMAKLSLPLLVGWGLDRLIRFRNPRLRVVMWRTVSVAVCLELLALNLPRLGHVPVAWDFSAAGTDRTPELVATPSDNEFSPAAPEAIAWSASMNLEPEEPVQPQCPAKAGDLAEARDRRLDEVDTSQSFLEPQQASVGSLVTASGGNTNRIVIGLFMLIYLSVVICLFFREIAAKLRALEIINRSDPVESDVSETFARQLNIANVPIRTSDEIGSPCVVGWRSMLRIDPFPMPRYVSVDVRDFASFGLVQRMLAGSQLGGVRPAKLNKSQLAPKVLCQAFKRSTRLRPSNWCLPAPV